MTRLQISPVQALDAQRAGVHRAIAGGRRTAFFRSIGIEDPDQGLPGPFNAMVRAPAVGMPLHRLGEALRYDGVLPDLVREIAILRVAIERDSAFEWRAHELAARNAGADDVMLSALRAGEVLPEPACERAATFVAVLLSGAQVPDDLLDFAIAEWGEEGAVELVVLVGYYTMLADLMRTFRVE